MKPSEPEFITIGIVVSPWGANGQLKVEVTTDFPQRFMPSSTVYVGRCPATIVSAKRHKGHIIVKLDAVSTVEEAEKLRGQPLEIHRSQLATLLPGQYYQFQLIGMEVRTTDGILLGTIIEILSTSSNDIYIVSSNGKEILIPAIHDVVKSIDLERGCMTVEAIGGLLDLNSKKEQKF